MKIITIVGARPQFIKASVVSRAFHSFNQTNSRQISEVILHTGQHYDEGMSAVFFDQMDIPRPAYNLGIVEKTHGAMTGKMLEQVERVLMNEEPDVLLVYGDTNSTLAGALAAAKLNIPVAHVEAGLRSFNMNMPEEINRVVTDRISDLLFCPTEIAVKNLAHEGIIEGVYNVGDVMYDATLFYMKKAKKQFSLDRWSLKEKKYVLCTVHRAENTDNLERLQSIFSALQEVAHDYPVVIPLHPRTRKMLYKFGLQNSLQGLRILDPVSYLEMIALEESAMLVITDSGGMQKEAYFHKVPCLTLRGETEWVETINMGWNRLCPTKQGRITQEWNKLSDNNAPQISNELNLQPFGNGRAAYAIVDLLVNHFSVY